MKKLSNIFNFLLLSVVLLTVSSCSNDLENKGYVTKFSDFSKIKAGTSTKQDVISTLGSPTTTSLFGKETWFYLGKEQTKETFYEPETKNYDGYEIAFDESGIVSKISRKGKEDLKEFEIAEDYTKTTGNEITVLQQLFGNLGKFNPAGRAGSGVQTGVTPGSRNPRGY
jgi:outer membrane protein assembly factor BamE (lipoprotein component of BamABCDE complex)